MKPKRHSRKPAQVRTTLAKRIAREVTIPRKWSLALGRSMAHGSDSFAPTSELELQRLLEKWRCFALLRKHDFMRDPRAHITGEKPSTMRKAMLENYAELGYLAAKAIMEGNYLFFSRLAALLQFNKRPDAHRRYADITEFCRWSASGDAKRPADAKRLRLFLEKRGHIFNDPYEDQTPRVLRADCRKLGIVLKPGKPGRPAKRNP